MNKEEKEPYPEEINLLEWITKIWQRRKIVLVGALVGAACGLFVGVCIPNEYTSTVKIIPESPTRRSLDELGGMALLAGINLPSSLPEETLSAAVYPDLVASTPFLYALAKIPLEEECLYHYCYRLAFPFGKRNDGVPIPASSYRLERREQRTLEELKRRIRVETDKQSGLVTFAVTLRDAGVAAIAADSLVAKLHTYILNERTERARRDYAFTQQLCEEAREKYRRAQEQYARFVDANQQIARESVQVERTRLNNEQQLAFGIYSNLAQRLEQARIQVQEQTPMIAVIEPAAVPAFRSSPRRTLLFSGCIAAGIVLAMLGIVVRELFNKG